MGAYQLLPVGAFGAVLVLVWSVLAAAIVWQSASKALGAGPARTIAWALISASAVVILAAPTIVLYMSALLDTVMPSGRDGLHPLLGWSYTVALVAAGPAMLIGLALLCVEHYRRRRERQALGQQL